LEQGFITHQRAEASATIATSSFLNDMQPPNPVKILIKPNRVYVCQGCKPRMTAESTAPPRDIVFSMHGRRVYRSNRTGQLTQQRYPGPLYFHPKEACVRVLHPTWKLRDIIVEREEFLKFSPEHFHYMETIGVLNHVLAHVDRGDFG
jgi:hypothetical protein